ncbi:MAG: alpha/beta hydrolase [Acidobacteriota bacterium]|nr:alpha/beta hydrolase [Acidobacteriota bacterium]
MTRFREHRTGGRGSALTWIVALLAVVALIVSAALWYVRENALAFYERSTRQALVKTGFELRSLDGEAGRLFYWEAGEGSTLVLLHGVGDQAGAFQGVVGDLLGDYRIVIPDLPGHGASEPSEGPLPMTVVYRGVEELLESLESGGPLTLVGHSMGAWLATVYAHRHPDRVARVIAVNGGPLRGERTDLSLMPADREAARTLMAALRDPASEPTPNFVLDDIVEQAAKGPIGRMMAAWEDFEQYLLDDRLSEVPVPVDLVWGESDQLMTLDYAKRVADQLPRARITTIAACGHHPANECPAALAEKLGEVLSMEPPAPLDEGDGVVTPEGLERLSEED